MGHFGLMTVHPSHRWLEPVLRQNRQTYVVVPLDEEYHDASVMLRLVLPPYDETGAVFVPRVLNKVMLLLQTGTMMVCGSNGEHCVCYHNGQELDSDLTREVDDADFLACWLRPQSDGRAADRVQTLDEPCVTPHFSESSCSLGNQSVVAGSGGTAIA